MEAGPENPDIQTQVFQATLAEISTSRHDQGALDCCVICLDEVSDPSTARPCGHANFDFVCLVSWLEVHPTCPLCKAVIREVQYGGGSTSDESGSVTHPKVYLVPRRDDGPKGGAEAGDARSAAAGLSTGDHLRSSGSSQRTFEHYFLGRHRLDRRRGNSRRDEPTATTRRATPPTPGEAILRRRHIYRNQLYSLHVGSNRVSQYRDLTPELFASDPNLVSRARQWIRRELRVFEFLSSSPTTTPSSTAVTTTAATEERTRRRRANNAEFLLEYTIAILKTVDMQGSAGQAEEMLSEFLGRDSARLFLHELRSWLRSPYGSLEAWDRHVQYPEPRPRPSEEEEEGRDSSKRAIDAASEVGTARNGDRGGRPRGDYWRPPRKRRRSPESRGRSPRRRPAHSRRETETERGGTVT